MKISKNTWIIIGIGIMAAAAALLLLWHKPAAAPKAVLVTVDGEEYARIPLTADTDETFTVETDWGHNTVIIRDGTVDVTEADCPNQICVDTAPAREIGDMIVCLPHKLVVEIVPGSAP